jgi:lipopolysaccharide/colanic/teichoic acid biosynthesis glycosyltransferase
VVIYVVVTVRENGEFILMLNREDARRMVRFLALRKQFELFLALFQFLLLELVPLILLSLLKFEPGGTLFLKKLALGFDNSQQSMIHLRSGVASIIPLLCLPVGSR